MSPNLSDSACGHSSLSSLCPPDNGKGISCHSLTDFYCGFFDLINVMAIMIDRTGTIRLFNRKAIELTGFSREEAIGQDCFSLLLPEESRGIAREKFEKTRSDSKVPQTLSVSLLTKSGARLPVSWGLNTVRDDEGKVFGLLGLGFISGPAMPDTGVSPASDHFYSYVGTMTHDLLNHSQVAMGYLELALERAEEDNKLQCMLGRAHKAVKKCGEIAGSVHRLSYGTGLNDYPR